MCNLEGSYEIVWKACIINCNYGSMTEERRQEYVCRYEEIGVEAELLPFEDPQLVIAHCKEAELLGCAGNPPVTREVIENLPNLKVIQRYGIGVDSVDLDAAREHGILVLNQVGYCIEELAAQATALALNLLRNVGYQDRGVRAGEWRKAQGFIPPRPDTLTVGLFGFGGSGRCMHRIWNKGFGSKIIACDPYLTAEDVKDYDVELVSFEELLRRSDILSIHAPLTEETYHQFDAEAFKMMKPTSMIVNIARGPIIDQSALIEALKAGEIRFAGLDVHEKEPMPADCELRTMEQVALTCHSAFWGIQANERATELVFETMESVVKRNEVEGKYIANSGVVSKIPGFRVL